MDESAISSFITTAFPKTEVTEAFGYQFYFYSSERVLPFATLANQDSEYDSASNLSRPGVFRLNIGVRKETYRKMFGAPADFSADQYDFTTLDQYMPHPDYAAQSWICILSPSEETMKLVMALLTEAYDLAKERSERKRSDVD